MELWTVFVELVRQILFVLALPLGGNLGAAIVVLSIGVRLALLPMTLRLAIKAQEIQRTIRDLAPELERLKRRYAADPVGLARETQAPAERNPEYATKLRALAERLGLPGEYSRSIR